MSGNIERRKRACTTCGESKTGWSFHGGFNGDQTCIVCIKKIRMGKGHKIKSITPVYPQLPEICLPVEKEEKIIEPEIIVQEERKIVEPEVVVEEKQDNTEYISKILELEEKLKEANIQIKKLNNRITLLKDENKEWQQLCNKSK